MNDQTQDPRLPLTVVVFLGLLGLGGLIGTVFLIHSGTDATSLLAVTSISGPAVGGLVGILASTRSGPPAKVLQAQAVGYQQAVDDVNAFVAPPAPVAPNVPVAPEPGAGAP